ncbi:MAG: FAD binding domain-containing protein [Fusobacteriaceae bacterium]
MIQKYFLPNSCEEAVKFKKENSSAKYLAGGSELNTRVNKESYDALIDIRLLGLKEIKWNSDETEFSIGANVDFQILVSDKKIPYQIQKAANHMECRNIRNVATIGGNIGAGSTVGDLIPTLMALEAEVKIFGSEKRISVEEYIKNKCEELIEAIIFKKEKLDKKYDSKTYRRVSSDFSILGAAVCYKKSGEIFSEIKIAIGGVGPKVYRAIEVEKELENKKLNKELVMKIMREKIKSRDSLLRGSADFREYLIAQMVTECFGINKVEEV